MHVSESVSSHVIQVLKAVQVSLSSSQKSHLQFVSGVLQLEEPWKLIESRYYQPVSSPEFMR